MAKRKRRKSGDAQQRDRIAALRRKIVEAAGERALWGVSSDCPADVEEQFLQQVLAIEQVGATPLFDQLVQAGVALPPSSELSDPQLDSTLRRVFEVLAGFGVYVTSTDHLSDRDLYDLLWHDTLRQPETTVPENPNITCMIDLTSTGSEEHIQLWLTYYATEEDREAWQADFPSDPLPAKKRRPHDRDRTLPHWPPHSPSRRTD